jgi:phospholipid transport system transporter-binding protein
MATTLAEALADAPLPGEPGLRLPAELTIYTAAETRSTWLAWLAGLDGLLGLDEPVCAVDASACDEVDAAGLQLLMALAHSLARRQRRLQLLQPPEGLRTACTELGLAGLLLDTVATEATA